MRDVSDLSVAMRIGGLVADGKVLAPRQGAGKGVGSGSRAALVPLLPFAVLSRPFRPKRVGA